MGEKARFYSRKSHYKTKGSGLPWWLSVRNPPANARDTGLSPGQGRSHKLWSHQAHVPQPLSLCSKTQKLQLLSPCATTTEAQAAESPCVLHSQRAHACFTAREPMRASRPESPCVLHGKRAHACFTAREAAAIRSPRTATRKEPSLATTREKPVQQRRPSTAKNK